MTSQLPAPADWPLFQREKSELRQVIIDNLAGQQISPFTFERWKVPTGGATQWAVETIDGPVLRDDVQGVIIDHYDARAYWAGSESTSAAGDAKPPDCTSLDCISGWGIIDPAETEGEARDCQTCPKSQWHSAREGRGQACSKKKRLFLLTPDSVAPIPVALFLPPTSIIPMEKYLCGLARLGLKPHEVVTSFSLQTESNAAGGKYSVAFPTNAGRLSGPAVEALDVVKAELRPILRGTEVVEWRAS